MKTTEFVDSYFSAWNRQDTEGIASHFSSSGLLHLWWP